MSDIQKTLNERGKRYGSFGNHATCTQRLKDEVLFWARYNEGLNHKNRLNASQKEALEMICHKIGRIVCGDPSYDDSWRDIAGYAMLIVNELNEKIEGGNDDKVE